MVKGRNYYCDKCEMDLSEKPRAELSPEFHDMPGEIIYDNIDLCPACWKETKRSFKAAVEFRRKHFESNVVWLSA